MVALYATIWAALAAFVAGQLGRGTRWDHNARAVFAAGLGLALVHTLIAFGAVYGWRHDAAVDATTQQTARVFGVPFGGGVFVNYAFFAAWLAEAVMWPKVERCRWRWALRAFYLVIIVNGAIVFAAGWRQILGAALTVALLATWSLNRASASRPR